MILCTVYYPRLAILYLVGKMFPVLELSLSIPPRDRTFLCGCKSQESLGSVLPLTFVLI